MIICDDLRHVRGDEKNKGGIFVKKAISLILLVLMLLSFAYADTADELIAATSDSSKIILAARLVGAKPPMVNGKYVLSVGGKEYSLTESEYDKVMKWLKGGTDTTGAKDELGDKIKRFVELRAKTEDYWKVSVVKVETSADASSNRETAKIVRIYLKWDANNGADRTKRMLEMYSNDIAVAVFDGYEKEDINKLWCFWEVPNIINVGYAAKYEYFTSNDEVYRYDPLGPLYGRN